jgi:cell wall-associated NlpC family hydrolase
VREQWASGAPVADADLQPGDLVFFAFAHRPVDHVGLYVGRGQIVHVSSSQRCVSLVELGSAPFDAARVGARRPVTRGPRDAGD